MRAAAARASFGGVRVRDGYHGADRMGEVRRFEWISTIGERRSMSWMSRLWR
jgi:hypothetical protein